VHASRSVGTEATLIETTDELLRCSGAVDGRTMAKQQVWRRLRRLHSAGNPVIEGCATQPTCLKPSCRA